MWTPVRGVGALIVLSSCLVVAVALADPHDQDRELSTVYNQPKWISQIKSRAETGFRLCSRRNDVAPHEGESCSVSPKICYFETQNCGVPHPSTRCECRGGDEAKRIPGKWSCDIENCPGCPTAQPEPGAVCTAEGITCMYGESRWYVPNFHRSLEGHNWSGIASDRINRLSLTHTLLISPPFSPHQLRYTIP